MSQKIYTNLDIKGNATIGDITNATSDTDKFLVSDAGVVKYRTGSQMLSDLGVAPGVASKIEHQVKASVDINKGQAVYAIPTQDGTNILVGLASNSSEPTSSKTMGLLDNTVPANGFANVVTEGLLAGLNTIGATVGDPVWLGTSGNLIYGLANKPYAPNHLVFIGIVTRVNANNGEIFVKVQNGFELDELHNVDLKTTIPINGHILGYDGTLWVNKTIAGWLGYTPANDANVVHLTGNETITGFKTFNTSSTYEDAVRFGGGINNRYLYVYNDGYGTGLANGPLFAGESIYFYNGGNSIDFSTNSVVRAIIDSNGLKSSAYYDFDNTSYYLNPAGSSNLYNVTANSFIKSGGTSSQFLKANGSVDSTSYYPASNPNGYISSYSETDTLATVTGRGATTGTAITVGSPFTVKGANPYTQWQDAAGTRLGYIQHATNLVVSSDTGNIELTPNSSLVKITGYLRYGNSTAYSSTGLDSNGFYQDVNGTTAAHGTMRLQSNTISGITSYNGIKFGALALGNASEGFTIYTGGYDNNRLSINASGNATFGVDARAPIFYDSANTSYYLDPASTSNLNILITTGYASIGGSAYLASGNYVYFDSGVTNDYAIRKTSTTLAFTSAGNFNFNNAVGIGASPGSYKLLVAGGQYGTYLKGGDSGTGSDILRLVDVFSNTKYLARGDGKHFFTGDTDIAGDLQLGGNYLRFNQSGTRSWNQIASGGNLYLNSGDGSGYFIPTMAMQTPIIYDYNNTGYYVDPSSYSYLNIINTANSLNGAWLGVNNTSNSSGNGISLYNGSAAGIPTYGLMFAGTGSFGNHGSVTSDWATYFTMNDDSSRGWIFKRGTTNVASISGGGVFTTNGNLNINGITTTPENSISLAVNGSRWVKLCTVNDISVVNIKGIIASSNSEESFEIKINTMYYADQSNIEVSRNTYNPRLTEVRVAGTSHGVQKSIYVKINCADYAPALYWHLVDTKGFVSIQNTETTPTETIYNSNIPSVNRGKQFNTSVTSTAEMRSPIYYDQDNTGYYLDPASTSNVSKVKTNAGQGAFTVGGNSSNFYPVVFGPDDTTVSWHQSVDMEIYRDNVHDNITAGGTFRLQFTAQPSNWGHRPFGVTGWKYKTGYGTPYNNPVARIDAENYGGYVIVWLRGGATYYYKNNSQNCYAYLVFDNASGTSWTGTNGVVFSALSSQDYYFSRGTGIWSEGKTTFTDTPQIYGDQPTLSFYSSASGRSASMYLTPWDMRIGNASSGNLYLGGSNTVLVDSGAFQAPLMYDINNTGYYCDPASTSNCNVVNTAGYSNANYGFRIFRNIGNLHSWQEGYHQLTLVNGDAGQVTLNFHRSGYTSNNIYYDGAFHVDEWMDSSSSFRAPVFYDSNDTSYFFDGSSTGDSIRVAGDIIAYYSDERLKDRKGNIENALEKVLSLNGFYYTPNAKAQELGYEYKEEVGVSAQEVEAILPELIKDAPIGQGYKTLNYGKLTPLLIEAIKEQNTELNNLKAELLELKELVNKLINK